MSENHTVTFREKRDYRSLLLALGGFLMSACATVLVIHALVETFLDTSIREIGVLELVLILVSLLLTLAVMSVILFGIVFFGGCGLALLKDFFRLKDAVRITPDGVWGETNIFRDGMIPWECIGSVKLELCDNKPVIAIQTAAWPPYPLWKQCSAGVRRILWQRHNRRQTPFYLYIHTADASPEEILQAIEAGLAAFRSTAQK